MYHVLLVVELEIFINIATFYLGYRAGKKSATHKKGYIHNSKEDKFNIIVMVILMILFALLMLILDTSIKLN